MTPGTLCKANDQYTVLYDGYVPGIRSFICFIPNEVIIIISIHINPSKTVKSRAQAFVLMGNQTGWTPVDEIHTC